MDWKTEIALAEDEANQAFLERNIEKLDELFSEDLLVNSPINRINDKKTLLQLLAKGVIGHISTTIQHELVRRDGDLVTVMGSDRVQNSAQEPVLDRRFTNIWRREGDRWRLWVRHANVIAK
jgi:hypothetical protein